MVDNKNHDGFFENINNSNTSKASKNNIYVKQLTSEVLDLERKELETKILEREFWIKFGLLLILLFCFLITFSYIFYYISTLLKLLKENENVIYLLGTYALSVNLALIYLFGSVFRSMFIKKEKKDAKDITIKKIEKELINKHPFVKVFFDNLPSFIDNFHKKK